MSTILDALKKSEQERNRNNVPTLSDMPLPQETSRWPLVLIALLSLTLALVLGVLISQWLFKSDEKNVEISRPAFNGSSEDVVQPAASEPPLSDLTLNVISYSEEPGSRFVMLNGKMFRENDFIRAGLKIEEIQSDAVVFNYRGERISRTP